MLPDHERELGPLLRAWRDVEPPARLDASVRCRARQLLARRLAGPGQEAGVYPAWLLALTAGGLVAAAWGAWTLPELRVSLLRACQGLVSLPCAAGWLCLAASNLLAALATPLVALWRRANGS